VDVVQLYDAFTINTLLFLEDLGFCPKGEGGRFVEDGRIAPVAVCRSTPMAVDCPVCTRACMGCSPWSRPRASWPATGARQVAGAEIALAHGNGGELSSQATVILGTDASR
jgi:hypothetical protein